jgi:glyoxylase-like metal-dependent hydrolase (beta-lactamase superfamily II)
MLLLRANNPSPWTGPTGNNTYLLMGATPALVDAGVGSPDHLAAIAAALDGTPLDRVLLTHNHPDHAGGLPAIASRWPAVRCFRFGDLPEDAIEAGDTLLRPVPTPGHSPDHMCYFDSQSRDLYCGDLIRSGGSIVIPASKGGNLRHYLDSLSRVRNLSPVRLLPGHGPFIDDPIAAIDAYVRHRVEREEQVIAALAAGARSPEEIAGSIYGALPPPLIAAAADTVLSHLIKLHDEGRAFVADDGWHLN